VTVPDEVRVIPGNRSRVLDWLVISPLVVVALYIRLDTLTEQSLWEDELRQVSYYFHDSFKEVFYSSASQGQPPLDYWIGYFLFKFHQSDAVARLPSAIFGTLLVLCSYFLARRLLDRSFAWLVAVAITFSPFAIYFSQEARPYAIFHFSLVLAILALSRAWELNRYRDWIVFLPILFFCQMTRALAPLMLTTGMGLWALGKGFTCWRADRQNFVRTFRRQRSLRLLACLVVAWGPFLYVLAYIMKVIHRRGYLASSVSDTINSKTILIRLQEYGTGLLDLADPFGYFLILPAALGVWLCLRKSNKESPDHLRLIFTTIFLGYLVHLLTFSFLVAKGAGITRYWSYLVPFLFIAGLYSIQQGSAWWIRRKAHKLVPLLVWTAVLVGLVLQFRIDRYSLIMHKPNWRGALKWAQEHGSADDVIFYDMFGEFGDYKTSFMGGFYYWDKSLPVYSLLRDSSELYSSILPELPKRSARVLLIMRCEDRLTFLEERGKKISLENLDEFEFAVFDQFFVLASRRPFDSAVTGLEKVCGVVQELYGPDHPSYINVNLVQANALLMQGKNRHAYEVYERSKVLVSPERLAAFEQQNAHLSSPEGG